MFIADAAFNQWLVNCAPRRRWGDVEDLGGAAAFVYRHNFYVDGGVTATL
jgi:gluconate 5-dehydrogenase